MSEVYTFREIAAEMAHGWGKNAKTIRDAVNALGPADVSGAALLYLVAAIERLRPSPPEEKPRKTSDVSDKKIFPGIKVGDILYWGNNDEDICVTRYVVVWVNDYHQCTTLPLDVDPDDEYYRLMPSWAGEDMFSTAEDALQDLAESEISYHKPKVDNAESALAAIKKGDIKDYCIWLDGGK